MPPDFPMRQRVTTVRSPDFTQSAAFIAAPEHQTRLDLFRRAAAGVERDGHSRVVSVDVVKTKHFATIVGIQVDHVVSRRLPAPPGTLNENGTSAFIGFWPKAVVPKNTAVAANRKNRFVMSSFLTSSRGFVRMD